MWALVYVRYNHLLLEEWSLNVDEKFVTWERMGKEEFEGELKGCRIGGAQEKVYHALVTCLSSEGSESGFLRRLEEAFRSFMQNYV